MHVCRITRAVNERRNNNFPPLRSLFLRFLVQSGTLYFSLSSIGLYLYLSYLSLILRVPTRNLSSILYEMKKFKDRKCELIKCQLRKKHNTAKR